MKALSVTVAAIAVGALTLLSSAPAVAAGNAVDPGDSMYAINCDTDYPAYQLFSIDSTTAFATAIGSGGVDEGEPCSSQPAYDPSTGKSYYVRWSEEGRELASIDVTTGVSTTIGFFEYNEDRIDATAIAIGADGAAYMLGKDFSGDDRLWTLNLTDASVAPLDETVDAFAFAADPVTGKFYAVDQGGDIFEIDVASGETTYIDTIIFPTENYHPFSLQFDGAGTFWVEVDRYREGPTEATLWSFTLATVTSPVLSGVFTDDPFYTAALLIIPGAAPPEPALAETGAELPMPLIAGAGSLVLLGAALLIAKRRSRAAA